MPAAETALEVLDWAIAGGSDAPPQGNLLAVDALGEPSSALTAALVELARRTAARLRLRTPPLGDDRSPGLSGIWLAAAVGARRQPRALDLVALCSRAKAAWELTARHGVVAPALEHVPAPLAESLLLASPLTQALACPAPGEDDHILAVCDRLREHPQGQRLLVQTFAQPAERSEVRRWRQRAMDLIRMEGPAGRAFVLDVYEAAIVFFHEAVRSDIATAETVLASPRLAAVDRLVERALSIAAWWGPLHALRRSHLEELRARRYLDLHTYIDGTGLHGRARAMTGGEL